MWGMAELRAEYIAQEVTRSLHGHRLSLRSETQEGILGGLISQISEEPAEYEVSGKGVKSGPTHLLQLNKVPCPFLHFNTNLGQNTKFPILQFDLLKLSEFLTAVRKLKGREGARRGMASCSCDRQLASRPRP